MNAIATKKIPAGLKPAEGQHILITVPNYWARGETLAEARKNLRANGGSVDGPWRVHSVHPETYVNDYGQINHPTGTPPVMLAEHNPS